jgi:hypothetical protein
LHFIEPGQISEDKILYDERAEDGEKNEDQNEIHHLNEISNNFFFIYNEIDILAIFFFFFKKKKKNNTTILIHVFKKK